MQREDPGPNPPPNQTPSQHFLTPPPGHFSNPADNMLAAATRLAAIPIEGESPAGVESWNAVELLQTAVAHQMAYSHSRDRVHSTPRPSRSYSRRVESPAVSSSEQRHNPPVMVTSPVMITYWSMLKKLWMKLELVMRRKRRPSWGLISNLR